MRLLFSASLVATLLLFAAPHGDPIRSAQSVVRVQVPGVSRSSAVVVKSTQLGPRVWELTLLTAAHGVDEGQPFVQLFRSPNLGGRAQIAQVPATVLGVMGDYAVIRCRSTAPVAPVAVGPEPAIGDEILASGFAIGQHLVMARGVVSSHERGDSTWPELWVGTCYCQHGMSGGAVLDSRGRLVGIVSAKYGRTEGILLFSPVPRTWLLSFL